MAEGILKKMLKERKIDYIQVSSAGTDFGGGGPASEYAIEIGRPKEIDLRSHTSCKLTKQMLKKADLILAMSRNHLDDIRKLNENAIDKSFLIKAFPRRSEDESFWVTDPIIGGTREDYRLCFQDLLQSMKKIFPDLIDLAKKKVQTPPK